MLYNGNIGGVSVPVSTTENEQNDLFKTSYMRYGVEFGV